MEADRMGFHKNKTSLVGSQIASEKIKKVGDILTQIMIHKN
jgi:hypothetical protein